MQKEQYKKGNYLIFKNHMNCFGQFSSDDDICINLCALSLKCAQAHQEEDFNSEILDELLFSVQETFMSIN